MALTKIPRGLLDTGIADSSDATAITIDSSENVTFAGNILKTGDLTLDVSGDITLDADGGDITLKDGGTEFAHLSNSSTDFLVQTAVQDKDIIFKGNDGGSTITALTLDMSDAGTAIFNHDVILSDNGKLVLGTGADTQMYYDGSRLNINNTGDIVFDASGNIYLDADGGDVSFQDAGLETLRYGNSASGPQFFSPVSDKDIIFKGNDGGSTITALTLDMSEGGAAIFNAELIAPNGATEGYHIKQTGGTATPRVTNDGNEWTIIRPGASGADVAINNYANTANLFTITDEGNVGLNENTPTSYYSKTFQINGSGTSSAIKLTNTATGNANNRGHDIASDSADMRLANREANGHWQVYTTAVTDSPLLALDVTEDQEVLTPKQPSFSARLANTSSVNASSSTYKLQYGGHSVPHNIGSHYSTSNYEFTAPVVGSYFFSANLRIDGFGGSYSYITLKHEATNGTVTDRARQLDSIQATYKNHHISAVVYMTVGEKVYVTLNEVGDGSVTLDADSWFNGYLLG